MRKVLRLHLSTAAHERRECWCQRHVNRWWYAGDTPTPRRGKHKHPDIETHAYAHLSRIGRLRLAWRLIKNNSQP